MDPTEFQATLFERVSRDVEIGVGQVSAIVALLDGGATVPFIARYRKEATGAADDLTLHRVVERLQFHRQLDERKITVLESIESQGKLSDELQREIFAADTRTRLEDLYLPFRPRRRTRATVARERGLEPLANQMLGRSDVNGHPEAYAEPFVDPSRDVPTAEAALQGARDIVAELLTETAELRELIRDLMRRRGRVHSKVARGKDKTASKYSDYYDFSEPVATIPSHRFLAILRGEREGFLSHRIEPDPDEAKRLLRKRVLETGRSIWDEQLAIAIEDLYDRLLCAQIATEIRHELKERSDTTAIQVFASNLRNLLMAPPLGPRPVLAIDPGMRTGCKAVILGPTGALLDHAVIHPIAPRNDVRGAERVLDAWYEQNPELAAIGIGNGTGGRETLAVLRHHVQRRGWGLPVVVVNEAGASVYSASEVGREEFPAHDVSVRGAVSIGRRLQDPLAELVKIDPKSIGVGQYQHDVEGKRLRRALDDVVIACVNRVGVDLNTASPSLLQYVSGLNVRLARSIVGYRDSCGGIPNRAALMNVKGLGARAFEQAAGFLRIRGGRPLDDSAVHPERYSLVERMAGDVGHSVEDLVGNPESLSAIDLERYVSDDVGLYTLQDIIAELEKNGRDPRDKFEAIVFRDDVNDIADLRADMILPGVVTNVTHFGAFVDVGVHVDGLVHISQIANHYVTNPSDELVVGQVVTVRVLEVDLQRRRVGLTIKGV
jgi:uncharacterized protein